MWSAAEIGRRWQCESKPPRRLAKLPTATLPILITHGRNDLVIDHLEDQKHNPDPELLKELGWTKDDLEKFVQRWKSLKESAPEKAGDKKELDEWLRSWTSAT